ncbi:hypothetical protein BDZ94DRAFT_1300261 [Collybia nuda]|uniref:Uncharacterized protein n=1 Tax=Collybia nuda TaxID=64659 RepID=A0A9P5XZZ1_9AGAR|nr:hypothetical protein BDZ94DRAFT_1300261 [Collybia nuda]
MNGDDPPTRCTHPTVVTSPSRHAVSVGYSHPTLQQRIAATTASGRAPKPKDVKNDAGPSALTFPAPLVLPGDDLSLDPRYPPQSFRAWKQGKDRNEITSERNVIYVAAPPSVTSEAAVVQNWVIASSRASIDGVPTQRPKAEDVIAYLEAFYHGLPVKQFPSTKLSFTTWEADDKPRAKGRGKVKIESYIALNTPTESVRIRTRATSNSVYSNQLNLDDLLDAAISILPTDAYALLMLVDHDIFEDEDDEFACGRAYGGSRVAVVSSARYDPCLDKMQGVDRTHAWPAAHCQDFIESRCHGADEDHAREPKRKKKNIDQGAPSPGATAYSPPPNSPPSPLQAAQQAFSQKSASNQSLAALYLFRLCRTSAHELGHCFGLDHCVYYACSMQGSASLAEDAHLRKVLFTIQGQSDGTESERMERRYEALDKFCVRFKNGRDFAAFGAWLEARLSSLCNAGVSPKKAWESVIYHIMSTGSWYKNPHLLEEIFQALVFTNLNKVLQWVDPEMRPANQIDYSTEAQYNLLKLLWGNLLKSVRANPFRTLTIIDQTDNAPGGCLIDFFGRKNMILIQVYMPNVNVYRLGPLLRKFIQQPDNIKEYNLKIVNCREDAVIFLLSYVQSPLSCISKQGIGTGDGSSWISSLLQVSPVIKKVLAALKKFDRSVFRVSLHPLDMWSGVRPYGIWLKNCGDRGRSVPYGVPWVREISVFYEKPQRRSLLSRRMASAVHVTPDSFWYKIGVPWNMIRAVKAMDSGKN